LAVEEPSKLEEFRKLRSNDLKERYARDFAKRILNISTKHNSKVERGIRLREGRLRRNAVKRNAHRIYESIHTTANADSPLPDGF
jgi:hypothetical protein